MLWEGVYTSVWKGQHSPLLLVCDSLLSTSSTRTFLSLFTNSALTGGTCGSSFISSINGILYQLFYNIQNIDKYETEKTNILTNKKTKLNIQIHVNVCTVDSSLKLPIKLLSFFCPT